MMHNTDMHQFTDELAQNNVLICSGIVLRDLHNIVLVNEKSLHWLYKYNVGLMSEFYD